MQYIKPYTYFWRKPKTGFTNLLMGCVCVLIPIVGPMVLLGYRSEVSEDLNRDPDMEQYPDFVFDKFAYYLKRGLAPFLTQVLFAVLVVFPWTIACVVLGILIHKAVDLNVAIVMLLGILAWILGLMTSQLVLWPMEYYAMTTGKFAPLKELGFAFRFLGKAAIPTIITMLIFNLLSSCLSFIGMLFIIGTYPAAAIQSMAEQHLLVQLYKYYLEEGGKPIVEEIEEPEFTPAVEQE